MASSYVLGIDIGTGGVRVGIFDLFGHPIKFTDYSVPTSYPRPGYAEQDPRSWWEGLVTSTRKVLAESGVKPEEIAGIGYDATSATVICMDPTGEEIGNAIMWMDVRATEQAARAEKSTHEARRYNGYGSATAEWFPFKAAWIIENQPEVFEKTKWMLDCPDWLGYKLTGNIRGNLCSASIKFYHDNDLGGIPEDFYREVGAGDALAKMPSEYAPMGELLGELTPAAAEALGLKPGTPVGQGGIDAEVGMIGMNVISPGKMALITGTSDVLLAQTAKPVYIKGMFGAYTDAVMPGQYTVEASQPSTGSALRWFKDNFALDLVDKAAQSSVSVFDLLNSASADIPPGAEGLVINEYFQGNRCPYTDSNARATLTGFSLRHTRFHLYKAIQEAACYGLEHNLRILRENGFESSEIIACGGSVSSHDWMQMHADVTGLPITITEVQDGPTLGSAMIGSVAAGLYDSIEQAASQMVHQKMTFEPNQARHDLYQPFVDQYVALYPAVLPIQQAIKSHLETHQELVKE